MKKYLLYLLSFTFIFLLFKYNNILLLSIIDAANIWFYKVFPYLFIMIIINNILISSNIINIFNSTTFYIFFMSLISGTPSSAYITGNLFKNGNISKKNANNILLFTYFSNPLFLWTILNNIFNNYYISIKLILIHYLSNIIIFFMYKKELDTIISKNYTYSVNLPESIKKSIDINLIVLGTICFYFIIGNILFTILKMPLLLNIILRGLLEMTQGLNYLININSHLKELLAITFISFGGVSIHTQVKCLLDNYNLDYKYFLKGRIMQTIISIFLTIIF